MALNVSTWIRYCEYQWNNIYIFQYQWIKDIFRINEDSLRRYQRISDHWTVALLPGIVSSSWRGHEPTCALPLGWWSWGGNISCSIWILLCLDIAYFHWLVMEEWRLAFVCMEIQILLTSFLYYHGHSAFSGYKMHKTFSFQCLQRIPHMLLGCIYLSPYIHIHTFYCKK